VVMANANLVLELCPSVIVKTMRSHTTMTE
jgi:hypothetical protein